MGILEKIRKKKISNESKFKAENILVAMMQQHIRQYPHAYFIRKGPKHITFKRR